MQIMTTVVLGPDDVMAYSPDAAAMQVLVALGGNAANDSSTVTIRQDAAGSAGVPQAPPGAATAAAPAKATTTRKKA